jgi:Leucine rich repeat/Leucine Rich repeat
MPAGSSQRFRRWRRYLRITVRGLIALVVVMALGLAWEAHRTRIQRRAVATIRAADGSVKYDWQWRDGEPVPDGKPPAPPQIVELIGVDHFGSVKAVELFPRSRPVRNFSAEDRANLDSALDSIKTLRQVEHVNLLASRVNDGELAKLNGVKTMNHLDLNWTAIGDAGLEQLAGLPNLTRLCLHRASITDAGLVHLKKFPKLTRLYLGYTRVTDAGLVHLAGLSGLSNLDLSGTVVSDLGLAHLKGLAGLTSLKLSNTDVTDAGLVHLRGLTNLAYLEVCATHVTPCGAHELEQCLPSLTVRRHHF